jgi:arylsulfatase A-like enzyme
MTRRSLVAIAVVLVVAGGSLAYLLRGRGAPPQAPADPAARPTAVAPEPTAIRNVILISLDTTRADAVSCGGGPESGSPNIAALARDGVVFERAYAPAPVTLPSHASLLTGRVPTAHGVFDNGRYALAAHHTTLAEVFRERGFNTAAFVSALVMESKFGLDQGFDTYDDEIDESAVIGERRGDVTTGRAIEWLEAHRGEENFLFLHLFDPHAPYEAPEPFASRARDLYRGAPEYLQAYAAEVAFADHCVGLLVRKLQELGLYDSSLICVTADHGESLGEHGENTHGYFIYNSTVKVPLVFKVPGATPGARVPEAVGLIDIPPTLLSLTGASLGREIEGRDLAGRLRGSGAVAPERAIVSLSVEPRKYGGSSLLGIIAGDHKYIRAPRSELYNLAEDPTESRNRVNVEPRRADELRGLLQLEVERSASPETPREQLSVDADTLGMLESLGYVVAGTGDDPVGLEKDALDPKDLIEYHRKTLVAMSYVAPENLEIARAACEDMIRMRPDFYLGYLMMGRVLLAEGREDAAYPFLEKANAIQPKQPT